MKRFHIEDIPLWNTETGWYFANSEGGPFVRYHVLTTDESANYLMRAFILCASVGIERFYWYAWNNVKMGGLIEPKSKTQKRQHMRTQPLETGCVVRLSNLASTTIKCGHAK